MNNQKIRIAIMRQNLKYWEVAKLLGIGETTLWRKLREELPEEEQDRIVEMIERGESND